MAQTGSPPLHSLRTPACLVDVDGVVLAWNAGMESAFGWAAADVVGRDLAATGLSLAIPDAMAAEVSVPVAHRDGTTFDATFLVTHAGDGTVLCVLLPGDDVHERLAQLQAVTARLSGARSSADVADVAVSEGARGVGASSAVLCLLTEDGIDLELVHSLGLQPGVSETWQRFPVAASTPAGDAVRTGELVLFRSLAERDQQYPVFAGQPSEHQAFATVPLRVGDRPFGAVTFGWHETRDFSVDDRTFLSALGEQCAQALDRARLDEAERRGRQRQKFLADASRVLASSLDDEATIQRLARLPVPDMADACAVHVTSSEGLRLVALAHVDPAGEALLRDLATDSDRLTRSLRLDEVARTREPACYEVIPPEVWARVEQDPHRLAQLEELGLGSGIAVPLVVSGRSIGVLAIAYSTSGRRYRADDVEVMQDLAARASVAIQNARSHRSLRTVAQTLQRSLLPAARPSIPGLDVAAAYRPVSESQVGGDFYDVFPLADNRWGAVIGDVCGKGVAAASLTALARYTVRASAASEATPSAVLRRLNTAILDEGGDDRFCTLAHLFVEPGDGSATITMAIGGHPLPLLVTAGGELRPAGRPGTAIGMFPDLELVDTVHTLGPGDALVLYTDGVLEARDPGGRFDPHLFEDAIARAAGGRAADLAEAVERAVLAFEGGTARDDMAVLVLRVPRPGETPAA